MAFIDKILSSVTFKEVSCIVSALKGNHGERTFPEKNDQHQAKCWLHNNIETALQEFKVGLGTSGRVSVGDLS